MCVSQYVSIQFLLPTNELCTMNLQTMQYIKTENKGKMKDCRKCFLVKQWATKSEIKDGVRTSYLAWHYLKLSYSDILEMYLKQLSEMSEHAFFASWNYVQYKQSKSSIQS